MGLSNRSKATIILSLLGFSGAIIGLKHQSGVLAAPSILLLIGLVLTGARSALFSLGTVFSGLFIGPSIGWLYGRDSNETAMAAATISEQGWPPQDQIVAFTETPMIHIHSAALSEILHLSILPGVAWSITISSVLPLIYVLGTLFIVYVVSRRAANRTSHHSVYLMAPILLWIPMYAFRTRFHRASLGLLLFAFIILVLFLSDSTDSRTTRGLLGLGIITVILTHHIAAFATIIFLLLWDLQQIKSSQIWHLRNLNQPQKLAVPLTGMSSAVLFLGWHLTTGDGAQLMMKVVERVVALMDQVVDSVQSTVQRNLTEDKGTGSGETPTSPTSEDSSGSSGDLSANTTESSDNSTSENDIGSNNNSTEENSTELGNGTSDQNGTDTGANNNSENDLEENESSSRRLGNPVVTPVRQSWLSIGVNFFSKWLFQLVLAVPILTAAARSWKQMDRWSRQTVLFGAVIALGGVAAWQTQTVAFQRLLTYFVVGVGWVAARTVVRSEVSLLQPRLFLVALLVCGLVTVPLHSISERQPEYSQGENSQRFNAVDYATADFVGQYASHQQIIGDGNVKDIMSISMDVYAVTRVDPVKTGIVPDNTMFVLRRPANEKLFFGTDQNGSVSLRVDNLSDQLADRNAKIYTSGKTDVYSRTQS